MLSTPDPDQIFVLSRGAGCFVSVNNPIDWRSVEIAPVLDVRAVPSRNMLVFADYTRLIAHGPQGLLWRSPRVAFDGFAIRVMTQDTVAGDYSDPTRGGERRRFLVHLDTGDAETGLSQQ